MYKMDLALNNLQSLICHKTKQNKIQYLLFLCRHQSKLWPVSPLLTFGNQSFKRDF